MFAKVLILAATFLVLHLHAATEGSNNQISSAADMKAMETVFDRSDEVHQKSMTAITHSMSVTKAAELLQQSHLTTPALTQATSMALAGTSHLRKQPKGYSGIDGARKLLNDMIFESMSKYDAEIAKCTEYYSKQCAAMEVCRGKIAAANYVAANSRALILDSQATINKCEVDIPTTKEELKQHELMCKHELLKLNTRLKIVMGDIEIMTMILEMTDCEKKLLQTKGFSMLHCEDQCTHKQFIKFDQEGLQKKVSQLQSTVSHELMQSTFADLFEGVKALESTEFLQTSAVQVPNKTQFNNPPVPNTEVPSNPCNDPDQGAPSAADKKAAKCTIKKSPQCYKLQERFLLIQAGIMDERDGLLEDIQSLEHHCEETTQTLENQISQDEEMLAASQTKLAMATEKESNAGEIARQTNTENTQLNDDLEKQMKTCSGNYINFETELCALKKIRGELYKMKGGGHSAFFQDCEVSKWDAEECTKVCKKSLEKAGTQKLTRSVLTNRDGGTKCLPLAAMRSCNNHPCPVDCELHTWSGWSKCSAECGGGVSQRLREVKLAMKYGGTPCGKTSQTEACNAQACEKDCELSEWTLWSTCSKDCDGGTQKREKFVKMEPEGAGECPDQWGVKRLQYKKCNMKRCAVPQADLPLACNKSTDVVLLLDGSGSLGKKGWEAEIKAAKLFVGAFEQSGKANMAVILYSGPRTWGGVKHCTGKTDKTVDIEKFCKIQTVTHFTEDLKKVKQLITGLEWPQGSTLTSLALMAAKSELSLGRPTSPSNVILFTDGRPMSYRKTWIASKMVRKSARLVWVPVQYPSGLLKFIKHCATRRWEENVIPVSTFDKLKDEAAEVVTHIVADICPKEEIKMEMSLQ
jgi:hypothetical protein